MQSIQTIDNQFYKELGKKVRDIRIEKSLTLSSISKITGYSRPLIDRWELGLTKIKPKQFEIICDALGVKPKLNVQVTFNG